VDVKCRRKVVAKMVVYFEHQRLEHRVALDMRRCFMIKLDGLKVSS